MRSIAYRPLRLAAVSLGVFGAGFAGWGLIGWGPAAANEQAIGEISRWCERVSGGFFREPINTLGNLGFVIAGLIMFSTLARDELVGRRRADPPLFGNTPIAVLYAGAAVFLGPAYRARHVVRRTRFQYRAYKERFHYNAVLDGTRAADLLGYRPESPIVWPASGS